jgi:hypothetical protein
MANLAYAKCKIADFYKKYPLAPKKLAAIAFDNLQPLFCVSLTNIMADLALFSEVLNFDWENGKC